MCIPHTRSAPINTVPGVAAAAYTFACDTANLNERHPFSFTGLLHCKERYIAPNFSFDILILSASLLTMAKTFSASDVAAHKKPDDLWIIVDEDVYDMTTFQAEHPGMSGLQEYIS